MGKQWVTSDPAVMMGKPVIDGGRGCWSNAATET